MKKPEEQLKVLAQALARCLGLYGKGATIAEELGKRYSKKHGAWHIYKDQDIEIAWDDYAPNLQVKWRGEEVLVVHLGDYTKFIYGTRWLDKLEKLYQLARAQKEKREKERMKASQELKWGVLENEG